MSKNKIEYPICVDEHTACHWCKNGKCHLLTEENKNCNFFKTSAQVRDSRRLSEKLNNGWLLR